MAPAAAGWGGVGGVGVDGLGWAEVGFSPSLTIFYFVG